jgi:hypothetical protein
MEPPIQNKHEERQYFPVFKLLQTSAAGARPSARATLKIHLAATYVDIQSNKMNFNKKKIKLN